MRATFFLACTLFFSSAISAQELTLPKVFNDHMVLQRDSDVRFWGISRPNSVVTILINDVSVTTESNNDGDWEAYLPKQEAGGPYDLVIDSRETITFKDVYFGDVWIAGGQSNMEWTIGNNIDNMDAELGDAEYPEIRFLKVAHDISAVPLEDLKHDTEWKVANKENARNFSAVAWFFAKHNHLEKGVPVGIIDDNWGGTPAEAWTPTVRLLSIDGYTESASEMLQPGTNWENIFRKNDSLNTIKYERVQDVTNFLEYGVHETEFNDFNWVEVELPNPEPLYDFVWLRKKFNLTSTSDAQLSFGWPGKFTVVFINGQRVYRKGWDDPKIVRIPPGVLVSGENVIALRTVEDWDNKSFLGRKGELWIETGGKKQSLEGAWKFSNTIEPPMPEVVRYEHNPGMLFNAMIAPVAGYSIAGAIWYQGESNVWANKYYNILFETMIEEWRTSWNQGSFPFLFVQLANFQKKRDEPYDSDWARLREAQTQALSLANTGMATIIDIGDANDIHPRNKKDVGYRLWQSAKSLVFNEDLVHSGPMYRGHVVDGNQIILSFNHTGDGLQNKSYDPISGFSIAGADSVFHWADARINGDQIIVESDLVENPIAVRYAWEDNPDAFMYNKNGLPMVPFRTDDW
ncbi:MAG: sialate O-acetylesterase [Balneolaceae bacterium]